MHDIHPPVWLYLFGFLGLIGPLVVIHELGHYLAGRLFGVKVETFSLGFGPEVAAWTDGHGTRWRLAALPLGGYVKFFGDANGASQPSSDVSRLSAAERAVAFPCQPVWQRAIIVAAGPFINLLFAALVFGGFAYSYGERIVPPVVHEVVQGSAAAAAGLQPGDRILTVAGQRVYDFTEIQPLIMMRNNQLTELQIERHGHPMHVVTTPRDVVFKDRFGNSYHIGQLGIAAKTIEYRPVGPLRAFVVGWREVGHLIASQVDGIKQMVLGKRPSSDLGGALRMAKTAGEVATLGARDFLAFIALISVAVGAINLLPIPVLDGGHLLLYGFEALFRQPVDHRIQEWAFLAGFVLILSLGVFSIWNDLHAMGVWHRLAAVLS